MDSRSTIRSNGSTFWGLIAALIFVIILGVLTATGTIGLAMLLPVLVLVAVALAATLWILGMQARRKMGS